MNIALCIISGIFGILSLIAAISQLRGENKSVLSTILMIGGSVVLLVAIACNIANLAFDFAAAAVGCAGICAAAVYNGLKPKTPHYTHNAVTCPYSGIYFFIILTFSCRRSRGCSAPVRFR